MISVTMCFKFPNGSIAIVVIMAWPYNVYDMDIIDCAIRDGHAFFFLNQYGFVDLINS